MDEVDINATQAEHSKDKENVMEVEDIVQETPNESNHPHKVYAITHSQTLFHSKRVLQRHPIGGSLSSQLRMSGVC